MITNYYILLSKNAPNFRQARIACYTKHVLESDLYSEMADYRSFDSSELLLKVPNGNQTWLDTMPWKNEVLAHWQDGNPQHEALLSAWLDAQQPDFDSPNDGDELPDTPEQRRSWWQRLLGLTRE